MASEAGNLSIVERQLGELQGAEAPSLEALEISMQREDDWLIPYLLSGAATARGDWIRGATLIGAAEAMAEHQHAEWPPDERVHYDATLAQLQQRMSGPEFETARAADSSPATKRLPMPALSFLPRRRRG